MLSSSYKEDICYYGWTFVENQYYFSKTYLQGESDLTEEEDRWDWDVEDIVQSINKPNMESAIEESK